MIDDFNREGLFVDFDFSLPSEQVIRYWSGYLRDWLMISKRAFEKSIT